MNGRILAVLLLVLGLSIGTESQLVCYAKSNLADMDKAITCKPGEQCAMYTAYRDSAVMKYYKKECLPANKCNAINEETFASLTYKVNVTCCDVNLCNGAQPIRMTVWVGMVTMMLFIFIFV